MNIFKYEFKSYRKFNLIWLIVIFSVVVFLLAFYPIFNEGMDSFIDLIKNLPANIRMVVGLNPDAIRSILGYYAFALIFITLSTSIQAMLLGLNVLSKETKDKTNDFLLAKPVSRSMIVTAKLMATFTWIVMSNILYLIGFYLLLNLFSNTSLNMNTYLLLTLAIFFLQILFLSLGAFIAVIIPKIKATLPVTLGTIFGFYLISTFADDKLRIISIFKYFDTSKILLTGNYDLKYLLIILIMSGLLVTGTYLIYQKKDVVTG